MDTNRKKRLLILVTNVYAATNFIHSGLLKQLAPVYDISILSDILGTHEMALINAHFNITVHQISHSVPAESNFIRFLRKTEKALFFHHFGIETQKIKDEQKPGLARTLIRKLCQSLSCIKVSKFLLQFLRQTIIRISKGSTWMGNWKTSSFDGIISTSPLDIRENILVNTLGIPSLAMIISWDNLTSKGIINANHDEVLVWNQWMAKDYHRLYQIFNPLSKIKITGAPRFDVNFETGSERFTSAFIRAQFNIPVSHQIILFTTSALRHFPNQDDIVGHLLEYVSQKKCATILLRCHAEDDAAQYSKFLDRPNLKLWKSPTLSSTNPIPELNFSKKLAAMIRASSVCIQVASTIRLETALCNKPCISIAYDGDLNLSKNQSVKRFYRYTHQLPLNKLGVDYPVYSKSHLFQTLDQILNDSFPPPPYAKIQHSDYASTPHSVLTTAKCIQAWLN